MESSRRLSSVASASGRRSSGDPASERLVVGIVDYLNTRPLAWGFRPQLAPPEVETVHASPARLADLLAAGRIDVGLVPLIEAARLPGVRMVSDVGIAAVREARSVLLVSRRPIAAVRQIALDEHSRTSAVLVRLLAARRWGIEPQYRIARPRLDEMLGEAEAALLIGDPALRVERSGLQVWDLAAEWRAMTGLPFVFAVWAARRGLTLDEEREHLFAASLELGEENLDEVVAEAAADSGLADDLLRRYYTHHLHFRLGPEERAGMHEFLRLAEEEGLVGGEGLEA